jgi:hypothetical protein
MLALFEDYHRKLFLPESAMLKRLGEVLFLHMAP